MPEHSWMEMVWFYKDKIQLACFALLFLFCLVRRLPAPECILAGLLFAMGPVDRLYHLTVGGSVLWHRANLGHLCIDALAMGCFFVIALKANRVYPLWIAGAQIIAMSGHFYRLALEEINTFAYDVMAITPSYIQLVALLLGVVFHMSRRKRLGSYPSWRIFSAPAQEMPARISQGG